MFNKNINQFAVGFDALQKFSEDLKKISGFPPYNIQRVGDNKYLIELAIAGYTISDVEIDLEGNVLTIKSDGVKLGDVDFLHKGFTHKAFERQFTLAEDVVVKAASMMHGVLSVFLEKKDTEQKKVKINIEQPSVASFPQVLNEDSNI